MSPLDPPPTPSPDPRPVSFASLVAAGKVPGRAGSTIPLLDRAGIIRERDRLLDRANRLGLRPSITRVLCVPRAIPLGGSARVVSELRLRHLAELQAFLEEVDPHPLDGMPPAWADPEPETRPGRLKAAWDASESWPPRLGTTRASEILNSVAGRAFFLAMMVGEHNSSFGSIDGLKLLSEVTPTQWAKLLRVAYAIHPRLEIAGEIAPDQVTDRAPANWIKSLYQAAGDWCQAAQFPALAELTLSQWRVLCSEGKALEFTGEYSQAIARATKALERSPPCPSDT